MWAGVVAGVLAGSQARAEAGESLFFGPPAPPAKARVVWDPTLPRGAEIGSGPRRPAHGSEPAACSLRLPVCVYRDARVAPAVALQALTALEQAYRKLILVLGLTRPPAGTLDLYLLSQGEPELRTGADLLETGDRDRARTFCLVAQPERADLPRVTTQCVGESIARGLDAAETPDLTRAYATELWWMTGGVHGADLDRIADAQAHPGRALATRDLSRTSENGALWLDFLEADLGRAGPAEFVTLLFALSGSKTPPDARQWHDEPDAFDVLRHTLGEKPSRWADLMGSFAVSRALPDPAWPLLASAAPCAPLHYDWNIKWSSLPRRLAPTTPLGPLGSMYVRIELDGVPLNATLGFKAEWESPVAMQWVLAKVDRDGNELSRLRVPFQERAFSVEQRLVDIVDAAAVLVVGVSLGGTDLAHPFDPDSAPFESHGCTVFLAAL